MGALSYRKNYASTLRYSIGYSFSAETRKEEMKTKNLTLEKKVKSLQEERKKKEKDEAGEEEEKKSIKKSNLSLNKIFQKKVNQI